MRILIAEDDEDQLTLTRWALQASPRDQRLEVAREGQQALRMLTAAGSDLPDLMLLDLHMPRLGGLEVLRIVRGDPRLCHLPIVVISASLDAGDEVVVWGAGATAFLHKTAHVAEFARLLNGLIDRLLALAQDPA